MNSMPNAFANSRQVRGLLLLGGLVGLVWLLSSAILGGDMQSMGMDILGIMFAVVILVILKDWRSGFALFTFWLLFEDLARKYLGNNMVIYFGKDVLAGVTFLSLYLAKRRGQAESFRPPFLVPLGLFFGLAFIQVFNSWTPSVLYGLLGLKLYFYYVPLMFVGYALIQSGRDLNRFLLFNVLLGIVIAALGIAQSIVGLGFLNPSTLAPELEELGNLTRVSPITNARVPVPTSVFVSGGRFAIYMIFVVILAMGAQGYSYLQRRKGSIFGLFGIGLALVGAMQSGSRGSILYTVFSILVVSGALFLAAPTRQAGGRRLSKAVGRSLAVGVLGLALMVELFPSSIGAVWTFYSETLSPSSSSNQLRDRMWDYPVDNLEKALAHERWLEGQGTGTASLGLQYIAKLVGANDAVQADVENGYGSLIIEMGILGPLLWMLWTFTCLYYQWKVVQQLRATVYYPVGFAIFWYSFLLLVPFTFGAISTYENFVLNAYFWILTGVLFRLPHLAGLTQPAQERLRVSGVVRVPAVARQ